jgi:microcystin-dependent protein
VADDRAAESEVETIARLSRDLDDLRSTVLARVSRRPTGDLEPAIRPIAKPDTLVANGQVVSRADYAALWQWAQDNGAVITGWFTAGDGATTFGLPNFAGLVPIGIGTRDATVYAAGSVTGAATRAMVIANLPAHAHGVAVANHAGHYHAINSNTELAGGHDNHIPAGNGYVLSNGSGAIAYVPGDQRQSFAAHYHFIDTDTGTVNLSAHGVTETSVGSGTPVDVRQPSLAVNWLVWT